MKLLLFKKCTPTFLKNNLKIIIFYLQFLPSSASGPLGAIVLPLVDFCFADTTTSLPHGTHDHLRRIFKVCRQGAISLSVKVVFFRWRHSALPDFPLSGRCCIPADVITCTCTFLQNLCISRIRLTSFFFGVGLGSGPPCASSLSKGSSFYSQ